MTDAVSELREDIAKERRRAAPSVTETDPRIRARINRHVKSQRVVEPHPVDTLFTRPA
jgi:hypothetical protein